MEDAQQSAPVTRERLSGGLARLGVEAGDVVLVHTSLRSLGWVVGGPVAVVLALQDVLTATGTLVMPAFTTQHSDPSLWQSPAVPPAWWETIREAMPAFRPDLTPTREMGAVAECFRASDGVVRSGHPRVSFAAWGRHAQRVTAEHALAYELGEGSPLARLYELGARVLFLGTTYATCTALHLAEYRADWPGKALRQRGVPLFDGEGERRWATYEDVRTDDTDFPAIGAAFAEATGLERRGPVGDGEGVLLPLVPLVDFGGAWLARHRRAEPEHSPEP